MDKQHVVHTNNGLLLSLEQEWNSDSCYNMDEAGKHYATWEKPDTKGQILYDSTYMKYLIVKFTETE